jgi:hypothetical protein
VAPRVRRYLTGQRASGGRREYGGWGGRSGGPGGPGRTADERWAAEVSAVLQGDELSAALPRAELVDRLLTHEMGLAEAANQAARRRAAL